MKGLLIFALGALAGATVVLYVAKRATAAPPVTQTTGDFGNGIPPGSNDVGGDVIVGPQSPVSGTGGPIRQGL